MNKKNVFYAQSGGVTAVINTTACGVIEAARKHAGHFGTVYAGKNGIMGALYEELIDTQTESDEAIANLRYMPGGVFGSCRYKLKGLEENAAEYQRLIEVFSAHDIGYFFYNGGGDSQDTAHKVSQMSQKLGYPMVCIGLPKTIDNDLALTDNCPGFGSVAKYIAVSTREAGMDVASMASTSTKVFILEVMGRHTGWIAASAGLSNEKDGQPPHIILMPEVPFQPKAFLEKVKACVEQYGYCVVVASEGIQDEKGQFLSQSGLTDAFGHAQLGGVASLLASLVKTELGYKYHYAISDYLQRAARHIASQTDLEQAYALGEKAIELALKGKTDIMLTIERTSSNPYQWVVGEAPLANVANIERKLPKNYISEDGFHITEACREYLRPLIMGEAYPPYENGLPKYIPLKNQLVGKKLPGFEIVAKKKS